MSEKTILAIETSCDETAISLVKALGTFPNATYKILGDALLSQVDIHREYGGVFPKIAKREHAKTLVPLLKKALSEADLISKNDSSLEPQRVQTIEHILEREKGLSEALITFLETYTTPDIDVISVTHGPGLEPALWVGVNFAKALSGAWHAPVIGINHMEGHILSSLFEGEKLAKVTFPAIALLISGGHTELVLMENWGSYKKIGQTRDDAVGEAFDKVARMLGLPYPGGPEISRLAEMAREKNIESPYELPRPMLYSGDLDFSFSGLKTAVLYEVKDKKLSEDDMAGYALAFENAVTEVLLKKTFDAMHAHGAETLILGGGVSANKHIRNSFVERIQDSVQGLTVHLPNQGLTTDNAIMIALAAHARISNEKEIRTDLKNIVADGNLTLETI